MPCKSKLYAQNQLGTNKGFKTKAQEFSGNFYWKQYGGQIEGG